jgi:hypothetical protein
MINIGKILIIFGLLLLLLGGALLLVEKIPFIGKLPGDIHFKKGNFTFYFPITTCILLSILLSIILTLLGRR